MSRVSYQIAVAASTPPAAFVPLGASAVATRNRDAVTTVSIDISKQQARWLKKAGARGEVDGAQVIRALIDVGMELDVDWSRVTSGSELRAAVRSAVMVRRSD